MTASGTAPAGRTGGRTEGRTGARTEDRTEGRAEGRTEGKAAIGRRLLAERRRQELSLRELGRRTGVTPSLISQIENGKVSPSVGTLYGLAEALQIPVERFFVDEPEPSAVDGPHAAGPRHQALADLVLAREARRAVDLAGGVHWELVRPPDEAARDDMEILDVTYAAGSESAAQLITHHGREYGLVLEGALDVEVDDERVTLRAGDSVAFDSTRPHRLSNSGDVPVKALWVVVGRAGDPRR